MPQGRARVLWAAIWPMALLCLLAANRWLMESAWPETRSTNLTESAGCLMAAGLTALGSFVSSQPMRDDARAVDWKAVAGGVLVLAGPAVAVLISRRSVHADDATLALSLVPVVAAVAFSALGSSGEGDLPARLWPGLAGLTGLLLLLPQPSLNNWRSDLALLCLPLIAGVGAAYAAMGRNGGTLRDAFSSRSPLWIALAFRVCGRGVRRARLASAA